MGMTLVALDFEYIPSDAATGDIPGPRPNVQEVYCEIMQIGACKLDNEGNEIGLLNLTVQAHNIQIIPPWLEKMTGMTAEKRSNGLDFANALQELLEFIGKDAVPYIFSGDYWVLEGNVKAHGMQMPFEKPFTRVKPLLPSWGITLEDYKRKGFDEVNSGNMAIVLGLSLPHIEGVGAHDAAHDARSLAYSVHHCLQKTVL
jgi:Exonuclease